MKYIDLHADTILPILQQGEDASILNNEKTSIDFQGLKDGKSLAQCFAVWLPIEDDNLGLEMDPRLTPTNQTEDMEYIELSAKRLDQYVKAHSDLIAWAKNGNDIRKNDDKGLISAILTMEDGRAVDGKLENIKKFYDLGFRMMAILWNRENCFGYPNSKNPEETNRGLKDFGIEAARYMNELGMIIDVSHLSDGGIHDLIKISKKPVIASHSNARAVADHPRNLTDDMIKGLANTGGIAGLCFSPRFLREDGEGSRLEDMIKHLDYMVKVGGEDFPAIGTDFDGTWGDFDIPRAANMQRLFQVLEDRGWNQKLIEKVAYKNALRVFDEM